MFLEFIHELANTKVFIAMAVLLLLGYLIGNYSKNFKLPKVTGYIITGIILGLSFLNIFNSVTLQNLEFIPHLTLGIIALIIGAGLSIDLLKHLKLQLLSITFMQIFFAFMFALTILMILGMPAGAAVPLAAIATATAPAATVAVIKEYKAFGSLTNMILAVVALDDAAAILLYGLILSFNLQNISTLGAGLMGVGHLFIFEIFNSFLIGCGLALFAHFLMRESESSSDNVIILLSMIFLGIGLSDVIHVSTLLTNMFFGFVLTNINSKHKNHVAQLEQFTPPIYCLFFVLAGAHLDFNVFRTIGGYMTIWAAGYIIFRFLGKVIGSYVGAVLARAPSKISKNIGLALVPQAGVAIGLTMLIGENSYYYPYMNIILNITLASVAVNEIIGPILARFALVRSNEAIVHKEEKFTNGIAH